MRRLTREYSKRLQETPSSKSAIVKIEERHGVEVLHFLLVEKRNEPPHYCYGEVKKVEVDKLGTAGEKTRQEEFGFLFFFLFWAQ